MSHTTRMRHLQSFAMKLTRWDRIYFFVFFATIFAIVGFGIVLFVPLIQDSSSVDGEYRKTLLAEGNTLLVVVSLIPIILAGFSLLLIPKEGAPDRSGKINLWISTVLIYLFVVWTIWSLGILFFPTAMLMTAASVGSAVRRRERTVSAKSADESKSGRGGGKRNRSMS
jgi:hypothetical protein